MNELLFHIEAEFRRHKRLGEGALRQLEADDLTADPGNANSVVVLVWHIAGNLESRFTDFLTADGEKSWRNRDSEFEARDASLSEVMGKWKRGWDTLFSALADLTKEDLAKTVTIRNVPHTVDEALLRAVGHVAYHVGQIVYLAKWFRGDAWDYLSIPPGKSAEYAASPFPDEPPTRHA